MNEQSPLTQKIDLDEGFMVTLIAAILAAGSAAPGAPPQAVMDRYIDFCSRLRGKPPAATR